MPVGRPPFVASLARQAEIVLDAFSKKAIPASVTYISKVSIITSTGATAFEVTLKIPKEELSLGMNGQAQITTDSTQNLAVPQEAVVEDNFVWIKTGRTFQKREVSTGIFSDTDIEIKSGLNLGDQVVILGFEEIAKKSFLQKIASL